MTVNGTTPVLNRVKGVLGALSPATRGEVLVMDADVSAFLTGARADVFTEHAALFGAPLTVPDHPVVPDSGSADYQWAVQAIDAALVTAPKRRSRTLTRSPDAPDGGRVS